MSESAYDGHPIQAGTSPADHQLIGRYAHYSILGLRHAVVVDKRYSHDLGNRSRREVEYICRDIYTGEMYVACRRLMEMSGIENGDDFVLHATTDTLSGGKATQFTPALQIQGDQVLLGFIDGSRNRPVILGVLRHTASSYGATIQDGERRLTQHQGTSIEIASNGEYTITHKSGSIMKFLDNGDVEVTPAGNLILAGAETTGLGSEGVVVGTGVDPFTGATYNLLNNASTLVFAKK